MKPVESAQSAALIYYLFRGVDGNILIKIFHLSIVADDRWPPQHSDSAPLSNFPYSRRNIDRNCRHLIKVLRQGENSSVTKTKTIIFQFISGEKGETKERGLADCSMWSSLAWLSHCLFIWRQASPARDVPHLPPSLPPPPAGKQRSQSVGHLQFSISPLSFLFGKTICHLDNFLHVQSITRWSIFQVLAQRTRLIGGGRGV